MNNATEFHPNHTITSFHNNFTFHPSNSSIVFPSDSTTLHPDNSLIFLRNDTDLLRLHNVTDSAAIHLNETPGLPLPGTTILPFWTCFFLESLNGTYPTLEPDLILTCSPQGKFLVGNGPTTKVYGHDICIILTALIWLTGLTGFISNVLCIAFIPKSMKNLVGSLAFLVVALASLECLTCISGILSATTIILILENAARNKFIFYLFYVTQPIYSFARVGVIYTTILISIERYLVVTFPTRARHWLTSTKSKLCFVPVIIFALLMDIPFLFNLSLEENVYRNISPNTTLADFPYIFISTRFGQGTMSTVWVVLMLLKTLVPLPCLIYFNGMLYRSIRMWNKRKRALTNFQKREIDAANMLSSVVLLILLWNIPYFLTFIIEHVSIDQDDCYRELVLFKMLCMSISTNVNFFMYFRYGQKFRQEIVKFTGIKWDEPEDSKCPTQGQTILSRTQSYA